MSTIKSESTLSDGPSRPFTRSHAPPPPPPQQQRPPPPPQDASAPRQAQSECEPITIEPVRWNWMEFGSYNLIENKYLQ